MSEQTTEPVFKSRITAHAATVMAKPATPEQIRAEQEAQLKLKEQVDGARHSNPL